MTIKLAKMKKINLTLAILFFSTSIFARAEEPFTPTIPEPGIGLSTTEVLIIVLFLFVTVLLFVSITLLKAFKAMYEAKLNLNRPVQHTELKTEKSTLGLWEKLLSLKPIAEEKNLEIPHTYDGIRELNNPVPAWFNVLFYGTLLFAIGYLYYYHIGEYGPRQDTEYEIEMAKAEADKRKFLAGSAVSIDENSVKLDETLIANGKNVYNANCIACHGDQGQGLVGPNLVDDYWLHGGSINDIFKTIKYGVPEKGMVSWEKSLSPKNISEVTNYIISLKGTKPANAKAPQGELYKPESVQDTLKNESSIEK